MAPYQNIPRSAYSQIMGRRSALGARANSTPPSGVYPPLPSFRPYGWSTQPNNSYSPDSVSRTGGSFGNVFPNYSWFAGNTGLPYSYPNFSPGPSPNSPFPEISYGDYRSPAWTHLDPAGSAPRPYDPENPYGGAGANWNPSWWSPTNIPGQGGDVSPLQNPLYSQGYAGRYDWGNIVPWQSGFYRPPSGYDDRLSSGIPAGMEAWQPQLGYTNPFTNEGYVPQTVEDVYGVDYDSDSYLQEDDIPPLPAGRQWTLKQMEALITDLARNQYGRNLFRPSQGWGEYFSEEDLDRVEEAGIFHERPEAWSTVPGFEENLYVPHYGTMTDNTGYLELVSSPRGGKDVHRFTPQDVQGWVPPAYLGANTMEGDPLLDADGEPILDEWGLPTYSEDYGISGRERLQYWQSQYMPDMDIDNIPYYTQTIADTGQVPNMIGGATVGARLATDGLPADGGKEFDLFGGDSLYGENGNKPLGYMKNWEHDEEFRDVGWGGGLSAEERGSNRDGIDPDGNPYTTDEAPRDAFARIMELLRTGGELTPGQEDFMDKWVGYLSSGSMKKKWRNKWENYAAEAEFDWKGLHTDWNKEWKKEFTGRGPGVNDDSPKERLEELLVRIANNEEITGTFGAGESNTGPEATDVGLLELWIPRLAQGGGRQREYWAGPHEWKRYGAQRESDKNNPLSDYDMPGYQGYRGNINRWGGEGIVVGPIASPYTPALQRYSGLGKTPPSPYDWMDAHYYNASSGGGGSGRENPYPRDPHFTDPGGAYVPGGQGYGFKRFEFNTPGYGSKSWGARQYYPNLKTINEGGSSNQYPHYPDSNWLDLRQQPGRYQNPVFQDTYVSSDYPYRQQRYRDGYAQGGILDGGPTSGGYSSEVFDSAERMQSKNGNGLSEIEKLVNRVREAVLNPGKESDAIISSFKNTIGEEEFEEFMRALLESEGITRQRTMGPEIQMSQGGGPDQYQYGGMISGPGDGLSDSVQSSIDGQEPVMLSDGEYVIPAGIVSALGNGSSDAGGKVLDGMVQRVGSTGESHKVPGKPIDLGKVLPT